ncbi:MAG TPA: putative toxin-antitoxin system toxin component, PIN family [Lentisphaeria bacterium]|nr:MAG: putative toxin-antitoxin system toxin component, PIN family [Lentisphaerae bacterium GWF2_50_93]HCE45604.1 putative toxin-antitoxin system toxin component, PIN family [Lentisphaeria bacterium]
MKVVVDTNVIVSGLLSPFSSSGEIVRMAASGELILCYDARVLSEYTDVLNRPKFKFSPELVAVFLDQIKNSGVASSGIPLELKLPDTDDEAFLEIALSENVTCLITGNIRHFPPKCRLGKKVLSPSDFIEYYRKNSKNSGIHY